jgi:hypothetical protein
VDRGRQGKYEKPKNEKGKEEIDPTGITASAKISHRVHRDHRERKDPLGSKITSRLIRLRKKMFSFEIWG